MCIHNKVSYQHYFKADIEVSTFQIVTKSELLPHGEINKVLTY